MSEYTIEIPFDSKNIELNGYNMHYFDEGHGAILLCVHGTPSSSLLYRHIIHQFKDKFRCIAIDHIGFGRSEKSENFDGKPEDHAKQFQDFIRALDLRNIHLVVHDFGGPIGLSSAIALPDRIASITVFNTWLWATADNPEVIKADTLVNSRLGKFLYMRMNISQRYLMPKSFHLKEKLTKEIHKAYTEVYANPKERIGLWKMALGLKGSSDWYQKQWEQLSVLDKKPWCFIWGTKDPFLAEKEIMQWKSRFPNAPFHELEAGHFLQEELPERIHEILGHFLENK